LTGFTNTQGRFLNVSPDACSANASTSTGRFIHLEQEFAMFRQNASGWDLMFRGLEDAIDCDPVGVTDVVSLPYMISGQRISFSQVVGGDYLFEIYGVDGVGYASQELDFNQSYALPRNQLCVVVVRSASSGIPVFNRKFYFVN
jgi:hypothetical protein